MFLGGNGQHLIRDMEIEPEGDIGAPDVNVKVICKNWYVQGEEVKKSIAPVLMSHTSLLKSKQSHSSY